MTKTAARAPRPKPEPKPEIEYTVVHQHAAPAQAVSAPSPLAMLNRAVEQGASLEMVEKLMELYERWRTTEAKRAFDNAIADAKAEFPKIEKRKSVAFPNKDKDGKAGSGGKTAYKHEGLDDIAVIDPILSKFGLSWRHRTTQEADLVTVTCIVAHRDGHAEETSLRAASDKTGGKNDIQAIGSTVHYLTRYTLKLALGLAATEAAADDDGKAASTGGPMATDHLTEIIELCDETDTDHVGFAQYMGADALKNIPDGLFGTARAKLLHKKKVQRAKAAAAQ